LDFFLLSFGNSIKNNVRFLLVDHQKNNIEMDADNSEGPYWVHLPDFWPGTSEWPEVGKPGVYKDRPIYDILLEEMKPNLTQGTVHVFGAAHKENRLTALFSLGSGSFRYSGRIVETVQPAPMSYLALLLETVQSPEFISTVEEMHPALAGKLPRFNACFVNWYRPPSLTDDKPDSLGFHSDDERSLTSKVILSMTFCQPHGEKLFSFQNKATSKIDWEAELTNGAGLIMLDGCQKLYKHAVSGRKTNSGGKLVGGRISLTFRQIEVEGGSVPKAPAAVTKKTKVSSVEESTSIPEFSHALGFVFFNKAEQENGYLSPFWIAPFQLVGPKADLHVLGRDGKQVEGGMFQSLEHYVVWRKALMFRDFDVAKEVFTTPKPALIRQIGLTIKNVDPLAWKNARVKVAIEGSLAMFSQHEDLKAKLLATGSSIIACTDADSIAGIVLAADDPKVNDMSNWKGWNLAGKVATEVRRRLGTWQSGLQCYANARMIDLITRCPETDYITLWQSVAEDWKQYDETEQAKWEPE
jgi:hypothetical protein